MFASQRKRVFAVAVIAAVLLLAHRAMAASEPASRKAGDPAPPIKLDKMLQAPPGAIASWETLKGKVVVVEFWATWCGPCVASIPHMNELAEKFKDKPVQFISITDEEASVVESFLKKKPISGWIGLDRKRSMFNAYLGKESGIPQTVLVDTKGTVAGITRPYAVKEEVLNDLLAGKKVNLPGISRGLSINAGFFPENPGEEAPLFCVLIRKTRYPGLGLTCSTEGRITSVGCSLENIICQAYDASSTRMEVLKPLPEGPYDLIANMPPGQEKLLNPLLQQALEATFGIKAHRETREKDVYVLAAGPKGAAMMSPAAGGTSCSFNKGQVRATGANMPMLAANLEARLDRLVIDKTGIKGRYDVDLQWEEGKPESLIAAVRDKLGLELKPAKRKVEILVVEKVTPEGKPTSTNSAP